MQFIYFIQISQRYFSSIFNMKFEVDQANTTFFKRYEDLVLRTEDNGLPDGVSKVNSFSFNVQHRVLYFSYLSNSIVYYV